MKGLLIYIFATLCFVSESIGKEGFGPGEQEWGYVQVRPYANMFWWLYYTTAADVKSYYDKPLIIWLQGGPGASSTAYGNFEEIGPLDVDLNPRNYTWVKNYNLLFIDNPVGSGFSYVTGSKGFVTTNAQIASDLLECMQGFYKQLPKFKSVPTYITTESYGGKMGAEFALVWDRAQKAGNIESNLQGVALGDAWISPIDSVMTWAPYLFSTGMVDTQGLEQIEDAAKMTKAKVESGEWKIATKYWAYTQNIVLDTTYNIDFYNILERRKYLGHHFLSQSVLSLDGEYIYRHFVRRKTHSLDALMNGAVKEALGLEAYHGDQSDKVFDFLTEDFMKPVTNIVESLLNETNLKVFVYNGHLDLIVDVQGTLLWVDKLKWKEADTWKHVVVRVPLVIKDNIEGYLKTVDNFGMYWINRAGHMVPRDNPAAMEKILQDLTSHNNINKI